MSSTPNRNTTEACISPERNAQLTQCDSEHHRALNSENTIQANSTNAHNDNNSDEIEGTTRRSTSNSGKTGTTTAKSALIRLHSDYKAILEDPPDGIDAAPLDLDNLFMWRAAVFGPADTPWEGGVFQIQMNFPREYPQKPPTIRFTSKIFHPNVFPEGSLCLDIIQDAWSPIYTVSMILTSIQSLLTDPNPASPANPEAAKLYTNDKKEYNRRVRAIVANQDQ